MKRIFLFFLPLIFLACSKPADKSESLDERIACFISSPDASLIDYADDIRQYVDTIETIVQHSEDAQSRFLARKDGILLLRRLMMPVAEDDERDLLVDVVPQLQGAIDCWHLATYSEPDGTPMLFGLSYSAPFNDDYQERHLGLSLVQMLDSVPFMLITLPLGSADIHPTVMLGTPDSMEVDLTDQLLDMGQYESGAYIYKLTGSFIADMMSHPWMQISYFYSVADSTLNLEPLPETTHLYLPIFQQQFSDAAVWLCQGSEEN